MRACVLKQKSEEAPASSGSLLATPIWLTALPLQVQGFTLNKQKFQDTLRLRNGWQLKNLPSQCVCGSVFTDHAMTCSHGGLTITRHNDVRDITANWLSEVRRNVEREHPYCLSQVKTSCPFLQTDVTMQELTFVQQASGDDSNVHFMI